MKSRNRYRGMSQSQRTSLTSFGHVLMVAGLVALPAVWVAPSIAAEPSSSQATTAPAAEPDESAATGGDSAESIPSTDSKASGPAKLSVAPLTHVEYPRDRPEWLELDPQLDQPVASLTVTSGPSETRELSEDRLQLLTRAAVASYVERLTGAPNAHFFSMRDQWIDETLVAKRYAGTLTQGDTTLHESAVRLHFSPRVQEQIFAAWQEARLRHRLEILLAMVVTTVAGLIVLSACLNSLCSRSERCREGKGPRAEIAA